MADSHCIWYKYSVFACRYVKCSYVDMLWYEMLVLGHHTKFAV